MFDSLGTHGRHEKGLRQRHQRGVSGTCETSRRTARRRRGISGQRILPCATSARESDRSVPGSSHHPPLDSVPRRHRSNGSLQPRRKHRSRSPGLCATGPLGGTRCRVGGPRRVVSPEQHAENGWTGTVRLDELVRRFLSVTEQACEVVTDAQACYFGAKVRSTDLMAADEETIIGVTRFEEWLSPQRGASALGPSYARSSTGWVQP